MIHWTLRPAGRAPPWLALCRIVGAFVLRFGPPGTGNAIEPVQLEALMTPVKTPQCKSFKKDSIAKFHFILALGVVHLKITAKFPGDPAFFAILGNHETSDHWAVTIYCHGDWFLLMR